MLPPVVSALITFIATLFRSNMALRLENLALRHQLAVYKQTVHRPRLRPTDRLFWAWLSRLWPRWHEALAFVQTRTVIAWQRQRFRDHWRRLSQRGTPGRPAIAKDVRVLIRAMWQANPTWGSPRIVGEPPSPTWKTFLKNHTKDLVALDCFTVPTVTFRVLFVLVILAHERHAISSVTATVSTACPFGNAWSCT
jgi:putative transposase